MTVSELIWDAMLQHIINGMASKGSRKWSRTTPEMAEKAKPENPDATPPRKIGIVSVRGLNSLIAAWILRIPRAPRCRQTRYCLSPDRADRRTMAGEGYH